MGGERHMVDMEAVLQDIYDALAGIGVELDALVEIERARAMYELGFDPLHGTKYDEERDG
jgi:hypothetical protein